MKSIERRQQAQISYESTIYWAEFGENMIPGMRDFVVSETSDLSPKGFSFFSQTAIESNVVLVALANPTHASHLLVVRIRHCTEGFWERERKYRIGGTLVASVENPFLPPNAKSIDAIRAELEGHAAQHMAQETPSPSNA